MRFIVYVKCDNSECKEEGRAEYPDTWLNEAELSKPKGKMVSPPYGWATVTWDFFGSGPTIQTTTCSVKCAAEAVMQQLNGGHE